MNDIVDRLCSHAGRCGRNRSISTNFVRSRLTSKHGCPGLAAFFGLQASGEAAGCPEDCAWPRLALANAARQYKHAMNHGRVIPLSFADMPTPQALEGRVSEHAVVAHLKELGDDILHNPVPHRLLRRLEEEGEP